MLTSPLGRTDSQRPTCKLSLATDQFTSSRTPDFNNPPMLLLIDGDEGQGRGGEKLNYLRSSM
eukprot:745965-Hanusia_phi.AAC.3